MKTISNELAKALVNAGCDIRPTYEGRGMAPQCFGIVLNSLTNLAKLALDLPSGVSEEFRSVLNNVSYDTMGFRMIVYFRSYQWPKEVKCPELDEDPSY